MRILSFLLIALSVTPTLACSNSDTATGVPQGYLAEAAADVSLEAEAAVSTDAPVDPPDAATESLPEVSFYYDAPRSEAADFRDSACAITTVEAVAVPLDVYILLDGTGSMGLDCDVGAATASKWCHAVNAMAQFTKAHLPDGTSVALQFFSDKISAKCDGSIYNAPAVPLLPLPGNTAALLKALNDYEPGGATPTEGALRGLTQFTETHKSTGRTMIGLVVTDGDPTSCNLSTPALAEILGKHFQSTGLRTFVIGMTGATFPKLEQLAFAGGAPAHTDYCAGAQECHYYNVADGDPQPFLGALNQIYQTAVACSYQIPTTDAGVVDPDKIVVQYTPKGTSAPVQFERVASISECAPYKWYFDNNLAPTSILFCTDTCSLVRNDYQAKIEILFGCLGT